MPAISFASSSISQVSTPHFLLLLQQPSSMASRLERLRAAIKNDVEKLPNLPKKPDTILEPELKLESVPQPARITHDPGSEDSEADCDIIFTPVPEDNK